MRQCLIFVVVYILVDRVVLTLKGGLAKLVLIPSQEFHGEYWEADRKNDDADGYGEVYFSLGVCQVDV